MLLFTSPCAASAIPYICSMKISVLLTLLDRQFSGLLVKVSGAGDSSMFHLMIDNYYYGRLRYSQFEQRWVFDSNKKSDMVQPLGEYMKVWANGHGRFSLTADNRT